MNLQNQRGLTSPGYLDLERRARGPLMLRRSRDAKRQEVASSDSQERTETPGCRWAVGSAAGIVAERIRRRNA